MCTTGTSWIIVFLVLIPSTVRAAYTYTDQDNCVNTVINGLADIASRPDDTTVVNVGLELYRVKDLDVVGQTFGVSGYIMLLWTDSRLTWAPATYNLLDQVYTNRQKIWTPPIVLSNSAENFAILGSDNSIPIRVRVNGRVFWFIPVELQASCDVDITYYPFDKQTCQMQISSWLYTVSEVKMVPLGNTPQTNTFEEHGEWELESATGESSNITFYNSNWSAITLTFKLKRKFAYYVINMVLPVVVLNLLGVLVFTLPAESGEKVGYSLTILLSLSVVLTVVADSIPTTSLNICILSVYLLAGFSICTLEVVMTVVVLKLFNLEDQGVPIGHRTQRFTRVLLARISCFDCGATSRIGVMEPTEMSTEHEISNENGANHARSPTEKKGPLLVRPMSRDSASTEMTVENTSKLYTWKEISSMVDKISLVFFMLVTVTYTLVFLAVLVFGKESF